MSKPTKFNQSYWIEQYSQFFCFCNWYEYNPIRIEFELSTQMGEAKFIFIILGIGFCLNIDYAETEEKSELKRLAEETFKHGE